MAENIPEVADLATRIKKLLGQGMSGSVVAAAVGCEPGYISQLLEDDEFKNSVLVLRANKAEGAVVRDTRWDNIEDMALTQAERMLPLVTRPADLIRLASMANAAKRRATEFSGGSENASQVVNLTLPESASIHFHMNANSQVVEVDGRSTAALPTKNLVEMVKQKKNERDLLGNVEVVMPRIPSANEKKKVESILEKIGYSEETTDVQKIM